MPSKQQLESRKKELEESLARLEKELADLLTLETELSALNIKIEEQTRVIAREGSRKRALEEEIATLEQQVRVLHSALEGDLAKFAEAFGRFKKSRAELQVGTDLRNISCDLI
jgi:vacuolar-type H+-ATPase subunit I/STV1